MDHLPTLKLSPKNQLTLPRNTDMVRSLAEGDSVYAVPFSMVKEETGERFPVLRLLTEAGKREREQEIREANDLSRQRQNALLMRLNGKASRMTVDRQNRVVLPAHQVAHLSVEKEVYVFESLGQLYAWNPRDWVRYDATEDDELADYLM